jgi:hypothetical protein
MPGTCAELPSRFDLAALADMAADAGEILVIDVADIVCAEHADLASRGVATTAATASRTAGAGAAIAAFTWTLGATEAAALGTFAIALIPRLCGAMLIALSFFNHAVRTFCGFGAIPARSVRTWTRY